MGVSGETAGSSRKERDDGGEIRHGSKRSDHQRLQEENAKGELRIVLLTDEVREKNTFEGNKGMFLSTLDEAWQSFLREFNQRVKNKAEVDGRTVGHGGKILRTIRDMDWTARESEERAARENDCPREAEAGYRGQPM